MSKAKSSDVEALRFICSSRSCVGRVVRLLRGELIDPSTTKGPVLGLSLSAAGRSLWLGLASVSDGCTTSVVAVCDGGPCWFPEARIAAVARRGDNPPFCMARPTCDGIGDIVVLWV